MKEIMAMARVVPVVTVEDASHARPIAAALVAGGLRVIEVTLRTPAALEAIAEMAQVPGAVVGAGTIARGVQVEQAAAAGARFLVSPGLTARVCDAARASGLPFLPGVATAGDIMRGLEAGLSAFKFFPAEAAGGIPALTALAAPFSDCLFCPTGGITPARAAAWLALPSVPCVGGSWLVPAGHPEPSEITRRAVHAAELFTRLT